MTPEQIAKGLSKAAQDMLLSAILDKYAGNYVGNGEAIDELFNAGLLKEPPADGGGTWGHVARLNDDGLAVRAILEEAHNAE